MTMPFAGGFRVESPFGYRTDPITGEPGVWHGGVDLVSGDRNVRAVCGGTILRSRMAEDLGDGDRTYEWGNYVSIGGDDGLVTYYCHLEQRMAEPGRRVTAGQVIGIEGTTGRSTGIHLHFEVRDWTGRQRDPCEYLGIPNRVGYCWTPEPAYRQQASDWAKDAVGWAVEKGILKGRGGDDWALGEPLTREEFCVMLYRAREVL